MIAKRAPRPHAPLPYSAWHVFGPNSPVVPGTLSPTHPPTPHPRAPADCPFPFKLYTTIGASCVHPLGTTPPSTACHRPLMLIHTPLHPHSYRDLTVIVPATTRCVHPRHASRSRGVLGGQPQHTKHHPEPYACTHARPRGHNVPYVQEVLGDCCLGPAARKADKSAHASLRRCGCGGAA